MKVIQLFYFSKNLAIPCFWISCFPGGSVGKEYACSAGDTGDMGLIPELSKSPGGGQGNPLQYSCLETPMDRGFWEASP